MDEFEEGQGPGPRSPRDNGYLSHVYNVSKLRNLAKPCETLRNLAKPCVTFATLAVNPCETAASVRIVATDRATALARSRCSRVSLEGVWDCH